MGTYRKGANAERELMGLLKQRGFCALRAAGSGVAGDCPDILAFNPQRGFAIECKAWDSKNVSIAADKWEVLREWKESTQLNVLVAWRMNREGWYFLPLFMFHATKTGRYAVSRARAREAGHGIEVF